MKKMTMLSLLMLMLTFAGVFQTSQAEASLAAPQCSYLLSHDSRFVSKAAQNLQVSVITQGGCGWTAVSNDAWITITAGSSGSGNGTVDYSVSANTGGTRTGTMTIAGNTFTVYQSASTPNCDFLNAQPSGRQVVVGGGSFSFNVAGAAETECSWTATSNAAWITITSGGSGNGNTAVNYSVAANGTGVIRVGTITLSGSGVNVNHTVTQKGS
jgi:hypothetical protein